MGFTTKREGFAKATELLNALSKDMVANGFEAIYHNGAASNSIPDGETTAICLKATTSVDPLAGDEDQPWVVFITAQSTEGDDGSGKLSYRFNEGHQNWLRIWVCTPTQIIKNQDGTWRIAYKYFKDFMPYSSSGNGTRERIEKGAGFLSYDSLIRKYIDVKGGSGTAKTYTNGFFYCFNDDAQNQEKDFTQKNQPNWGKVGDFSAHPLSYRITLSDHGISFAMWAEAYDSDGQDQAWFCVQRMVDKDTGAVIVDGLSPLFCVFSLAGNGDLDPKDEHDQIMYLVVRESDVTAPTLPRSAVIDTADSTRIINNKEQVAVGEDEKFIIHFPNGLSTQRYGYPHELDMIAYTSADAVSQNNEIELTFYGESTPRKYVGLGANASFNRGMRMLMITEAEGII